MGTSVTADFRVVAATNRNLEEEVAAGRFRRDLYFRLNVVPIALPSLRNRRPDIVLLAEHFLQHYSQKHGFRVTGFTEEAILKLQRYTFPGNVRELEHIVERAVLQGGGRVITPDLVATNDTCHLRPTAANMKNFLICLSASLFRLGNGC